MNSAGEILENSNILVEGNRIVSIEPSGDIGSEEEEGINIDASECLVLPGFVNTHHHLYQTLFRNVPLVQNAPLFDWLTNLYDAWRWIDPEAVRISALVGLGELLLSGCTTSTDHFYLFPASQPGDIIDSTIAASEELGIRFHPTRGGMSLGRSSGGLPPDEVVQDEKTILADYERVLAEHHDPDPLSMCRIGLAPCSPFSVTERLMRETAAFAREHGLLLHTHLAETLDEERFCLERYGKRPLALMETMDWVGPDVWFAHAVHMNREEIRRMSETGTAVAHCPGSNMRLGSGTAPVPDMLKAGVTVGLAVDGSASNDSSNMLRELSLCLLAHRAAGGPDAMTAYDVLYTATMGGAKLLGREKEIGSLEPGKAADIIVIDMNKIGFAGSLHDPAAALVFCAGTDRVTHSIVNGAVAVENGRLTGGDEANITARANEAAGKILKRTEEISGRSYLGGPLYPSQK